MHSPGMVYLIQKSDSSYPVIQLYPPAQIISASLKEALRLKSQEPMFPREMALNREGGQWCPWVILMVSENTQF